MSTQQIVIENLRQRMKERGWSSNRLADYAGISRSYLAALLAGRSSHGGEQTHSMTLATLDKIADALEVEVEELVRRPK